MKPLQAIFLLSLSKLTLAEIQKPLTADVFDEIKAYETQTSLPPVQTKPAFQDPFGGKDSEPDPAILQFLGFTNEPDAEERHVWDVEEDEDIFPEPIKMDYATYKATKYNEKGDFYTYSNIRYAAPPVGDLRFAAPQDPLIEEGIQTGKFGHSCIQAFPDWMIKAMNKPEWLIKTIFGTANDNEDCLFLDVKVPKGAKEGDNLPVVVWIYGGGYIFGKKDFMPYNPTGMFKRTEGKMIFVAMNYRMGAYGFLTGPLFAEEHGFGTGVPNAALHDQRFALKWVEKYIHLFGGDPENVTIMGESAGGGSIVHHLVWQDPENARVPFQRAIPQSPAWVPVPGGYKAADDLQDKNYKEFLLATACRNLQCLRGRPSWSLKLANSYLIAKSPMGTFNFGPSVDGKYIPDLPGKMLKDKKFSKGVEVMVGLVGMEGSSFADKEIANATGLDDYLKRSLPLSTPEFRQKVQDLYPISEYNNYKNLSIFLAGEAFINCNSYFLAHAYGNQSYHYTLGYQFADDPIPATHGADVSYTFWNNWPIVPVNLVLASALQKYLVGFFTSGDPNAQKVIWAPKMRTWGEKSEILLFDAKKVAAPISHVSIDEKALERCAWWQDAPYAIPS